MAIVCGKCGSKNIFGAEHIIPGEGSAGHQLSCLQCGNTSESRKYGFKEIEEKQKMVHRGDCGNCPAKNVPIALCNPPLCWTCQKAAQGKKGDERVQALAEIREKIIKGEIRRSPGSGAKRRSGGPDKSSPVEEKAKIKPQSGGDVKIVQVDPVAKNEKVEIKGHRHKNFHKAITLCFTKDDGELLSFISEDAKKNRRTIQGTILFAVDRYRTASP